MRNGEYCIYFVSHQEGRLILRYCPNLVPDKSPGEETGEEFVKCEPEAVTESWRKAKIDDFVQKLGFLDSSQSNGGGSMQQAFRHITDVRTCIYYTEKLLLYTSN